MFFVSVPSFSEVPLTSFLYAVPLGDFLNFAYIADLYVFTIRSLHDWESFPLSEPNRTARKPSI
ncbi:hypothetical protein CW304_13235 [Bacillus sp. UFRGS-B20]|nr:hypothetical protein CW304_13235 [Bacillus sp. UFRGS-B20]